MANLNSPGVQVNVIDESFYTPSAPGTIPIIFVASAQDKINASGTLAKGTLASNVGKVWLMTSQRDLADTFGVPSFYTDASSNPLHGDELNEYGLQAAYSLLGVTSRAYIVRVGINTAELVPQSSIPKGKPVNGSYWVDTSSSIFGIKEWNNTTKKFTSITPLILDDTSPSTFKDSTVTDFVEPDNSFGQPKDYCIVFSKDTATGLQNPARLFYKNTSFQWESVLDGFNSGHNAKVGPHYDYPDTSVWATGDVWITTTTPSNGANWKVKRYNASTNRWDTVSVPLYATPPEAAYNLGASIPVGTLYIDWDQYNDQGVFRIYRRNKTGPTEIVSEASSVKATQGSYVFKIRETLAGDKEWDISKNITINPGDNTLNIASYIPAAIAAAGLTNVSAVYNNATSKLTITHRLGGDFELADTTNTAISDSGFIPGTTPNLYDSPNGDLTWTSIASNWKELVYSARATAPSSTPADGLLWYSSIHDEVDIMIHDGSKWVGYQNEDSPYYGITDPNGPIVAAVAPDPTNGNSEGDALAEGDMWISTADMERYGKDIYVFSTDNGWVKQDVTDQSTPDGWLFADARWSSAGDDIDPASIQALLTSNYLDPDAPDPAIYPKGMRLVNTRRSGFNVKKYNAGYIDIYANEGQNIRYNDESMASYNTDRWVSQHNVAEDGSGVFGRMAQRAQLIQAFKATIDSNADIRDSDTVVFNLIATPGYPEAIQNMINFNVDRGITAFVIGDTPFRLEPNGTALSAWGTNLNKAFDNGDDGGTSFDEYMAMYYPSGYTNDNIGNKIVVPPSHMMLRTFINSDAKSYVWFAPAGTRRGGVDNATSVGYITSEGEFKTAALHQGLRDVLYDPTVKINPIATLPGVGIVAYGQRTRARNASSLDRINVARLVCYLRRQLDILARPFLFEPNDAQTRREIKAAAESLMLELVGQRALYDFVVVCDETNNTPARIDRSELYLDIAIEPVKAVEFIYIPLRLKNTGDIKAGL